MKYTLSLYLILAIDFVVIALKVKYAGRNVKKDNLPQPVNNGAADMENA